MVATLNPGDEVVIPDALLGELSRHGAAGRRRAACSWPPPPRPASRCEPADLEAAITPRTRWLILNSPSNPSGAAYTKRRAAGPGRRAAAPSARLDPDRRHVRAPGVRRLRVRTIAQVEPGALRAHPDHERGLQGLRHDRLADRLRRRARAADQRHAQGDEPDDLQPLLDLAMGGGGGAERAAGLHQAERQAVRGAPRPGGLDAEPGARACTARRRRAPSTSIRRATA